VIGTGIQAAFMAAVGVRTSLATATATRAMAITIGIWLGASILVASLAGIMIGVALLLVVLTVQLATMGSFAAPGWILPWMPYLWSGTNYAVYVVATLLLISDTRLRFDRIAGRMSAGRAATAVDALIHGKPKDPWRHRPSAGAVESLPEKAVTETVGG
jgi:hypothetical protein